MKAPFPSRRQRGFSLVELMVALVIGMFSVLVIMQLLQGTTTSRRIAAGGGDAQTNGVAAIRALAMDIEQAGLGLQSFNLLGCSLAYQTAIDTSAVTLGALAPVTINPAAAVVPAGDANTDTLLVMAGGSSSPSEGDAFSATTTSTSYTVTTPGAFFVNDRVIGAPAVRSLASCALQAALVTAKTGYVLTVAGGTAGLVNGSIAFNLGMPTVKAYAVRNGDLTVCDYVQYNCGLAGYASPVNPAIWVPVAGNIASLRAQYARDTSGIVGSVSTMDGIVDTYDQVTPGNTGSGATADTATIAAYCKWARIVGVRLAVVARNQQYDKTLSYTAADAADPKKTVLKVPTWDGTSTPTDPNAVPIVLSGYAAWANYRYSTSQTLIPLRNLVWQGAQGQAGTC